MNPTTSKMYQMLIDAPNDDRLESLLETTYCLYNRGARIFSEFFLNLCGSINPARYKQMQDTHKLKEFPAETVCFLSWFSSESNDVPADFVLNRNQIKQRFEEYWEPYGDYDEQLLDDHLLRIPINDDRFVFVDRRASFYHWNQEVQLQPSDLDSIFLQPKFNFYGPDRKGANDKDDKDGKEEKAAKPTAAIQFWGGLFSKMWGVAARKSDPHAKLECYSRILDDEVIWACETYGEFQARALQLFGYKDVDVLLTTMSLKKGRNSSLKLALLQDSEEPFLKGKTDRLKNLRNSISAKRSEIEQQVSLPAFTDGIYTLRDWLSRKIGVPYLYESANGKTRRLANNFAEMAGQAWGRLLSSRSNACNYVTRRVSLLGKYDARPEEVNPYIDTLIQFQEEQEQDGYTVRPKQLSGILDFLKCLDTARNDDDCESLDDAIKAALGEAMNIYNARREKFGSHNLMRFLAKINWEEEDAETAKLLISAANFLDHRNRGLAQMIGGFRHVDREECPIHVQFGESRPPIKLHGEEELQEVTLELYDGSEFVNERIRVRGRRAIREVFFKGNGSTVFRNDTVSREAAGVQNGGPVRLHAPIIGGKGHCGAKLMAGHKKWNPSGYTKWYLNFTVNLEYPRLKMDQKPKRIMSVDLNMRNPAAVAELEIVEKGGFEVRNKDDKLVCRAVVVPGSEALLDHLMEVRNQEGENQTIDIFRYLGRPASKEELAYLNGLKEEIYAMLDRDYEPYYGNHLVYILYRAVLDFKLCFRHAEDVRAWRDRFIQFVTFISPTLAGREGKGLYDIGALSEPRLGVFDELRRTCDRYSSNLPEGETDEEIAGIRVRVFDKYNGLRRERYRKTVAVIKAEAVRRKVDAVVIESMPDLKTDQRQYREMNRKLSSWYHTRISQELKENLPPLGIRFYEVDARNTSHYDVDGTVVVLMDNVFLPLTDYMVKKWDKLLNGLVEGENTDKNFAADYAAEVRDLYERFNLEFGVDNFRDIYENAIDEGMPSIYLPRRGGLYCVRRGESEVLDNDLVAARQIGMRGLRMIYSPKKNKTAK